MLRLASMAATAALLLSADMPGVLHLQKAPASRVEFPASANLPVLPDMRTVEEQAQSAQQQATVADEPAKAHDKTRVAVSSDKTKQVPLQPESILFLVRYVDGEFVRVVNPLPAGKKGFHLKAGEPVNQKQLRMALGSYGAAVNPGDSAQITKLEFKDREIIVDINGGGRGKTRLRDRIHLEIGGIPTLRAADPVPAVNTNTGATLFLDFDRPLPDMTPDQLKEYLSGMLDFSKQHSAAVQWIDTLPPDIQKAIQEKRAAVGMDREMVMAAIGRPDQKVRERTPAGAETEDWIYGHPPAKTIFVKFEGEKVISVEQFPK
jgi:hypothetical protein